MEEGDGERGGDGGGGGVSRSRITQDGWVDAAAGGGVAAQAWVQAPNPLPAMSERELVCVSTRQPVYRASFCRNGTEVTGEAEPMVGVEEEGEEDEDEEGGGGAEKGGAT